MKPRKLFVIETTCDAWDYWEWFGGYETEAAARADVKRYFGPHQGKKHPHKTRITKWKELGSRENRRHLRSDVPAALCRGDVD